MILTIESVYSRLDTLAEEILLTEARFIRVVRAGKIVKKVKPRKGFKVIRSGGKIKMKRMTFQEKRTRKVATTKAWRKGKSSRIVKSARKLKISLRKRKSIFG